METRNTKTASRSAVFTEFASDDSDTSAQERLNVLLKINAESAREKSLFKDEGKRIEAALMRFPFTDKQAFAYLGFLLGAFPPAAIFARMLSNAGSFHRQDVWVLGIFALVNLISATVGYFSGKLIGKIVGELEKTSWTEMLFALPFLGVFWGAIAGGACGAIIFLVGAVFGAVFGASIGVVALPVFGILHRTLKCGGAIERKHFLPLAFGIVFTICAFILGL